MKIRNFILFSLLIGIPLFFVGCADGLKGMGSNFTIKVSGTPGLNFKGHYAISATVSNPNLQNVAGTLPTQYEGKGLMALCLFRKTAPAGSLKVEILKGEKLVAQGETLIPYGVVSLKTAIPGTDNIFIQILKKFMG